MSKSKIITIVIGGLLLAMLVVINAVQNDQREMNERGHVASNTSAVN